MLIDVYQLMKMGLVAILDEIITFFFILPPSSRCGYLLEKLEGKGTCGSGG